MMRPNTARARDEKEFFNLSVSSKTRRRLSKYYEVRRSCERFYEAKLDVAGPGSNVLEYGCGTGSQAFRLAQRGAIVHGIDISDRSIEVACARADELGLKNTTFTSMDAESMSYPDSTFDLVCGAGILHHLDLTRALSELTRVLKPGGSAIFIEPLGHNPALRIFRKLTPRLRTVDEHPLLQSDLLAMHRAFATAEFRFFHLLDLFALLLRRTRLFLPILGYLGAVDERLFRRIPWLRRYAWYVVIVLQHPHETRSKPDQPTEVAGND